MPLICAGCCQCAPGVAEREDARGQKLQPNIVMPADSKLMVEATSTCTFAGVIADSEAVTWRSRPCGQAGHSLRAVKTPSNNACTAMMQSSSSSSPDDAVESSAVETDAGRAGRRRVR